MNRLRLIIFGTLILFVSLPVFCQFGSDLGSEDIPSKDLAEKKEKQVKQPDAFIGALSRYFSIPEKELARFWARGYGRNELIKLILISKDGRASLREIARAREKKMKLRDISGKYGVDFSSVTVRAAEIRKELDSQLILSTETYKNKIHYTTSTVVEPSSSTAIPVK